MVATYSIFALALAATRANAFTYWIDVTCNGKVTDAVINEVKSMGSEAAKRLNDNDELIKQEFELIFKTPYGGDIGSKALTAMSAIAGMTSTDDQPASDVRIYCDEDSWAPKGDNQGNQRWQRDPDLPNQSKKHKNTKKPDRQARFFDMYNFITRDVDKWGCQDHTMKPEKALDATQAQTWANTDVHGLMKDKASLHNPNRAVISMCDKAFSERPLLLSDIGNDKDIVDQIEIGSFEDLVSVTLFHEFCHTPAVLTLPGGPGEVYGYEDIYGSDAATNAIQGDAFAFLGLAGILNARNVKFATDKAKADEFELDWIEKPKPNTKKMLKRATDSLSAFGSGGLRWLEAKRRNVGKRGLPMPSS